jgi:hypothetical protein
MAQVSPRSKIGGLCVLLVAMTACMNVSSKGSSQLRRVANPTEIAAPLTSHSAHPELLPSINSIQIAKPVVVSSSGHVQISADDAQALIEQVARETMTLKIVGASSPALKGKGAAEGNRTSTKADAELVTEVLRYEDRSGSAIGGEPAVISFRMAVKSLPGGQEVWGGQYFYKQEALSENLLKIGERMGKNGLGAGWRTAHDIFRIGVSTALGDFSAKREQRFMAATRQR